MKGHKAPNYVEDKKYISESIDISTIRWLLGKPIPSMLCVCDEGNPEEPIYYVWIKDVIEEIEKSNPSWESQDTVNLRIPTSKIFNTTSHESVENYVKDYYTKLRIHQSIGEVMAPSESLPPEALLAFREKPENFIYTDVAPKLKDAGLVDITDNEGIKKLEKLSVEDQSLYKRLREASIFLTAFNDREAERILLSIDSEIEKASDGIKARYFNNKGVLALRYMNHEKALDFFERAYKLRPKEAKFATNYLLTRLLIYLYKDKSKLPENFIDLLDEVIKENPEFWPALRLKTYWRTCPPKTVPLVIRMGS